MTEPVESVRSLRFGTGGASELTRAVPAEVPIALVYDGTTQAVMMATPADLEDYAVGFSLTERIVANPDEIADLSVVDHADGIELRMWLVPDAGRKVAQRRRSIIGPTGCGLCGVESLAAAAAAPAVVQSGLAISPDEVALALVSIGPAQVLNHQTRAVHAAAFWSRDRGLVALREDVGRHNALDKLAGTVMRGGSDPSQGVVVLTSRVSVEMVQKTAAIGVPIIIAISAPTALAIKTAEAAGMTLIAVARPDAFEVFTHPRRVVTPHSQKRPPAAGSTHAA